MSWVCSGCKSEVDDEIGFCWRCGTGINGEPPPDRWKSERGADPDGSDLEIARLRCSTPMSHLGAQADA